MVVSQVVELLSVEEEEIEEEVVESGGDGSESSIVVWFELSDSCVWSIEFWCSLVDVEVDEDVEVLVLSDESLSGWRKQMKDGL